MKDYIARVLTTKAPVTEELIGRLTSQETVDILHGLIGLQTETGEFADRFKRSIFYGKMPDNVNFAEEVGDILWYLGIILNALGLTFEQCMEANIAKLAERYKKAGKFSEMEALTRNLDSERQVLETNLVARKEEIYGDDKWTATKEQRRQTLIENQKTARLSLMDRLLLEALQKEFGEYQDRVAPLHKGHGYTPEGFAPCTREPNHTGPCAHPLLADPDLKHGTIPNRNLPKQPIVSDSDFDPSQHHSY